MRSYSTKQPSNCHQLKSKKIMQYVNLISIHQNDKKVPYQKKITSTKSSNNQKHQFSKDLNFNSNQISHDKLKPYLKSEKQIKKHNRSKTQCLDNPLHDCNTINLIEIPPSQENFNLKKKKLQKQESKIRLKTQSLKVINPLNLQRATSNKLKQNISHKVFKQTKSFKQKSQKMIKKKRSKNIEGPEMYLSIDMNYDPQILKKKFRRQTSDLSRQNCNRCNEMRENKIQRSKKEQNRLNLLNLSQILHKNQGNEATILDNQSQQSRRGIKQNRQSKLKHQKRINSKINETCNNLSKKIVFLTNSINQQLQRKYCFKFNPQKKTHQKYDINARSFSFMNSKTDVNHLNSNFSTGIDSLAIEDQLQELTKLKIKAQTQICLQVSQNLQQAKEIIIQCSKEDPISQQKFKSSNHPNNQRNSPKTFRQVNTLVKKQSEALQFNNRLLQLLQNYNTMTQKILPFIYQFQQMNPQVNSSNIMRQKNVLRQNKQQKKQNKKFLQKYEELFRKNTTYQTILNQMIQDGVNVQKYMAYCCLNNKK